MKYAAAFCLLATYIALVAAGFIWQVVLPGIGLAWLMGWLS